MANQIYNSPEIISSMWGTHKTFSNQNFKCQLETITTKLNLFQFFEHILDTAQTDLNKLR